MNTPQIFQFNSSEVRVLIGTNGSPWWVAKDVAAILEIKNTAHLVTRLDEDEKKLLSLETTSGQKRKEKSYGALKAEVDKFFKRD